VRGGQAPRSPMVLTPDGETARGDAGNKAAPAKTEADGKRSIAPAGSPPLHIREAFWARFEVAA